MYFWPIPEEEKVQLEFAQSKTVSITQEVLALLLGGSVVDLVQSGNPRIG